MKKILSVVLMSMIATQLYAQTPPAQQKNVRNYNVKNSFWFETNIVGNISKKFQYQLDVQYRTQSDQAGQSSTANLGTSKDPNTSSSTDKTLNMNNIFKNGYQFVFRPWIHYFPLKDRSLRLSISPLGYWSTIGNAKNGFNGAVVNPSDITSGEDNFQYPELRTSLQGTIYSQMGRFRIQLRERYEFRWIGDGVYSDKVNNTPIFFSANFQDNTFKMRSRTMVRADIALKGQTIEPKEFYIAMSDEIFVGLGKNTKEGSLLDQNRAYVGLGYKLPIDARIEFGYLNQINPKEGTASVVNGQTVVTSNVDFNNVFQVLLMFDNINKLFKKAPEQPKL